MGSDTEARHFLKQQVLIKKQIITYRLLSRQLSCTVGEARRHLDDFRASVEAQQARVHATYMVISRSRQASSQQPSNGHGGVHESGEMEVDAKGDGDGDGAGRMRRDTEDVQETKIELADEEELEEVKKELEPVSSVQIYSVEPSKLADVVLLCAPNELLHTDKRLVESWEASNMGETFGLHKHPGVRMLGPDAQKRQKPPASTTQQPAVSGGDQKTPSDKQPGAKRLDRKAASASALERKPSTSTAKPTKPIRTESQPKLNMKPSNAPSNAAKRKSEANAAASKPKVSKTDKGKGKSKAPAKEDSAGDEEEDPFAAERRAEKAAELAAAAADAEDVEMEDAEAQPSSPKNTVPASRATEAKASAPVPTGRKRVTKTRIVKVPKVIKEKDSKGYRVRREVIEEVEEVYTDWESDPCDAPKKRGAARKAKKAAQGTKQGGGPPSPEATKSTGLTASGSSSDLKGKEGSTTDRAEKGPGATKKPAGGANLMSFFKRA